MGFLLRTAPPNFPLSLFKTEDSMSASFFSQRFTGCFPPSSLLLPLCVGWITLQSAPTLWGRTQQMEAWVLKVESSGPIIREHAITSKRGLILCARNFIRIVFPQTRNNLSESLILTNTGLLSPASPARPSPRNLLWVTHLPKPRELPTKEDSAVNICQGENIKQFWRWYRG